jgi:hypothetical protein
MDEVMITHHLPESDQRLQSALSTGRQLQGAPMTLQQAHPTASVYSFCGVTLDLSAERLTRGGWR